MGSPCHDLYYWCRSGVKLPNPVSADPEIPICDESYDRANVSKEAGC